MGDALDPRAVGLYPQGRYRRSGFRFEPFDPARPIGWTDGRWLGGGRPVLVPAGLVWLAERDRLCQATSNGLAAAETRTAAELAALCELVERDAVLAHWVARRPARPLLLPAGSQLADAASRIRADIGSEPRLALLEAATATPVVVCLLLGDGRRTPAVALGAACRADVHVAAAHALAEAAAVARLLRGTLRRGEPVPPSAAVRTPLEHALLRLRRGRAAVRFLLAGRPVAGDAVPPGPRTLAGLVEALQRAGLPVASVSLAAPAGWHVVRVLACGLQPLWFGAGYERLLVPRVRALLSAAPRRAPHPLA